MDSRQIALVQESFQKIPSKIKVKMTRVLYDRLFELNPNLKKLFKSDIREQRKKLLKVIEFIIENLNDANMVGPILKELGKKHKKFNVQNDDYITFGKALMFSLSAALGNDFTTPTKKAWQEIYDTISQVMIDNSNY